MGACTYPTLRRIPQEVCTRIDYMAEEKEGKEQKGRGSSRGSRHGSSHPHSHPGGNGEERRVRGLGGKVLSGSGTRDGLTANVTFSL